MTTFKSGFLLPLLLLITVEFGVVPRNELPLFVIFSILIYLLIATLLEVHQKKWPGGSSSILILSLATFLASFLIIFNYYPVDPNAYPNDPEAYNHLAKNIVQYKEYGQENAPEQKEIKLFGKTVAHRYLYPTAYRPVGYPTFIAAIYAITHTSNHRLVTIAQFLLHLVALLFLWKLVRQHFDQKIANAALLLYILNTPLLFIGNNLWSETLAQSLIIFFIYLYIKITTDADSKRVRFLPAALAGILGGWLILTKPVYLIYIPVLLIYLVTNIVKRWSGRRVKLPNWPATQMIVVLLITTICGGWALRNSLLAGKFTSIATNGGINMFLGNNPYVFNGRAAFWPPKSYVEEVLERDHKDMSIPEIHRNIGFEGIKIETENDAHYTDAAWRWIKKNPARFIKLALNKVQFALAPDFYLFGNPQDENNLRTDQYTFIIFFQTLYFWVFLFLALIGSFTKKALSILLLSLPYLLMVIVSFAEVRFQIPLYIPLAILAGLGAVEVRKIKRKEIPRKIAFPLIVFSAQFFFFKNTLLESHHRFMFERQRVSASYNLIEKNGPETLCLLEAEQPGFSERFISKIYKKAPAEKGDIAHFTFRGEELSRDEFRKLIEVNSIYTTDINIFSGLYPDYTEEFYLQYDHREKLPLFLVKLKEDLPKEPKIAINEALTSDWANQEKKVPYGNLDEKAKLISMEIRIAKNSQLTIKGQERLIFNSWPKKGDEVATTLYFPTSFFRQGIEILINNRPVPKSPHQVSIDTLERDSWTQEGVVVKNITYYY